ncbi:MAG: ABC transporter permease [Sulfolobales archaeon]
MNIRKAVLIIVLLVALAFISPVLAPYDPFQSIAPPYQSPSLQHLLGTDGLGRDIFSQLLFGLRITLIVSMASSLVSLVIGLLIGLASSLRSIPSQIVSALIDSFIVIPPLLIMIFIASIMGPLLYSEIIAISLSYWPQVAKTFRAETLSILQRAYIEASVAVGGNTLWILRKHVMRNLGHVILANYTYLLGVSIVSEAVMSFLGLADQRYFSCGMIFRYAFIQGAIYYGMWQWILAPALVITIISYILFEISKDILTK